jgi:competence protein ComEC
MKAGEGVAIGLAGALGWAAGLALQLQQSSLASGTVQRVLAAAGLLALLWSLTRAGRSTLPRALSLVVVGCALLSFAGTSWRAQLRLDDRLPATLEAQDIEVVGTIARLPVESLGGVRFVLAVEAAWLRGKAISLPGRLSLGWFRGPDADALLIGPPEPMRAGQRWQLTVRLRQVHGSANPHGFDFELWMFEQGIGATGHVRSRAALPARKLADDAAHPVERLRQSIRDRIRLQVQDPRLAGVLSALAVGDQAAIERLDWDLFRDTGIAHLMSISGLHVTMLAWLAAGVIAAAWRHSAWLSLRCPAPSAGRWGGLACALGYAVLAGWGVPAQRTVLMLATVVVSRSLGWRWPGWWLLLVAGSVVMVLDPWSVLQPGFWLSFVAVGLLMASGDATLAHRPQGVLGWRQRLQSAAMAGVRTQLVATVALSPLTLVFFQQVSLVSLLANLMAIPLVTLVVAPLALAGVLLPPLWTLAAQGLALLQAALEPLAALPWAVHVAAAVPPWVAALGVLGGSLLVLPWPWRMRALGLPMLWPLLMPAVDRPAQGFFEAVSVDVGQGTAVLVRTRHKLLVYDAGPQYSPEADAGDRVLLPLLRARGESAVDLLMLSHRDTDHVGGAASLMRGMPVRALSSSLPEEHALIARSAVHTRCQAGQRWEWDGVSFEVLHPYAEAYERPQRANALSCVVRVSAAERSLLLTGDVEQAQELALVERQGGRLASRVMTVPHHGSRTSSSAAFIDQVAPQYALVQAAYRSRFGHPAADVLERYAMRGVTVVRSDRCGAWTWPAVGEPWCERVRGARYWHHRADERGTGSAP